ncbi:MAG: hypothetical protein IJ415_03085 [Clostridia bacterium]|nr:hypothetical protein [Clostridia bacterium]
MRKILLIISIVFVVLCYGYPCLILPFGSYHDETTMLGTTIETTYEFKFNGKVKITVNKSENEYYYKLKGNEIIISDDKTFNDDDNKLSISSIYKVGSAVNQIGQFVAIGIGVMALVLVCTIPNKRD